MFITPEAIASTVHMTSKDKLTPILEYVALYRTTHPEELAAVSTDRYILAQYCRPGNGFGDLNSPPVMLLSRDIALTILKSKQNAYIDLENYSVMLHDGTSMQVSKDVSPDRYPNIFRLLNSSEPKPVGTFGLSPQFVNKLNQTIRAVNKYNTNSNKPVMLNFMKQGYAEFNILHGSQYLTLSAR